MTDARIPERYLNDRRMLRLSDLAFRAYVLSLLWSVSNRTDGQLDLDDVALVPGCTPEVVTELSAAGLWRSFHAGWLLVDFAATQTTAHDLEVLENVRRADRDKKRRARAAKALETLEQDVSPGQSTGTIPQDSTGKSKSKSKASVEVVGTEVAGGRSSQQRSSPPVDTCGGQRPAPPAPRPASADPAPPPDTDVDNGWPAVAGGTCNDCGGLIGTERRCGGWKTCGPCSGAFEVAEVRLDTRSTASMEVGR